MYQYIAQRLLLGTITALLVSLFAFGVVRIVPGDALLLMIEDTGGLSPEQMDLLREEMGIGRPFVPQYLSWLGGVFRGDLGTSIWTGRPVLSEIGRTLPLTLELGAIGIALATLISIPIGVMSAMRRNSIWDFLGRLGANLGLSIPSFALGITLILIFSLYVGWLPPMEYSAIYEDPIANLQQMMLPAISVGLAMAAINTRMVRSATLEVLGEDYVRTARAKGLQERTVITRHVLKNAFIPVMTILGLEARRFLGSTVVIETVFVLPGLGRLTLDALLNRDFIQLQGNLLIICLLVVAINLLVDLSYAWLNPRIRYA